MKSIEIGDVITSYDFGKEVQPDCYMMGRVYDMDNDFLYCEFISGQAGERGISKYEVTEFKTPLPGNCMMDDVWTRIETY